MGGLDGRRLEFLAAAIAVALHDAVARVLGAALLEVLLRC